MSKIAFLFAGQGSQYAGMGKNWVPLYPEAQEVYEEANEAAGFDLAKLTFEGSIEELTRTENTQPVLVAMSVAAYRVYMNRIGAPADLMAGHSLGEISALACAGAISLTDAIRIARKRGLLMQAAAADGAGAMAAISGVDQAEIERQCALASRDGYSVSISNINAPSQIVISGHKEAVQSAIEALKSVGGRAVLLKVGGPFHSSLMAPAAESFSEELLKYSFKKGPFGTPVLSNISGRPYEGGEQIVANLVKQIVAPVQWVASMKYLAEQGVTTAIEFGPGAVLTNLMSRTAPEIQTLSFDKSPSLEVIKETIEQVQTVPTSGSRPVLSLLARSLGIAVSTRNRNWDQEAYKKGVSEPYKQIQQLQEKLEQEGREPSLSEMKEAVLMLESVFKTKGTPPEEAVERFEQLFAETGTGHLFQDYKVMV